MQQTQQHFSATEYELQQQQPQYLGKHDAAVKYMQQLGLHKQNIKVDSEVSAPPHSCQGCTRRLIRVVLSITDKTLLGRRPSDQRSEQQLRQSAVVHRCQRRRTRRRQHSGTIVHNGIPFQTSSLSDMRTCSSVHLVLLCTS